MSGVLSRPRLVEALVDAVEPGRRTLTATERAGLAGLTAQLVDASVAEGRAEYETFRAISERRLTLDAAALREQLTGRTVVVTGGTGCIGSALLERLQEFGPARVISISRGHRLPVRVVDGVEYRTVDVRDLDGLTQLLTQVEPDVIYHLAAQHDPGLAEVDVAGTLSTNVTGTANIVEVCRRLPGTVLVHASTGKALRPFSRDVYAGSKKMAEWVLSRATDRDGLRCSAVRFTHVVDNSIIGRRLAQWTASGEPVRLHSVESMFYLQCAGEAAELLLCAGLDVPAGEFRIHAIRDLGWPVSLLDLAIGFVGRARAEHGVTSPIYVCGFEAGYERAPYPGLYDPQVSGTCSPLFNAWEGASVRETGGSPDVDAFRVASPTADARTDLAIDRIRAAAADHVDTAVLRGRVDAVGWSLLASTLRTIDTDVLVRHVALLRSLPEARFWSDDRRVRTAVLDELDRRGVCASATPVAS
jgi:NADP-dependent 3-hydroxy acid dehydrogenase YdfG